MRISKNTQTTDSIKRITESAFPGLTAVKITEMTLGMCNALYKVELSDGRNTALKISSPGNVGKLTNERWLMQTEVAAMNLMNQSCPGVRVPRVLYYDNSRTICSGDYFFMEFADGTLMRDVYRDLDEAERKKRMSALHYELGEKVREICSIKGTRFGILSSDESYKTMFDFIYAMTKNALDDCQRAGVDNGLDKTEVLRLLERDKSAFDEVTEPFLVHFDVWPNNVMIENDHIGAILDWERALFGDPLMEERFRIYSYNPDFYAGFGITSLTETQKRRRWWYDLELLATMTAEGTIRGYEDDSLYTWAKGLLDKVWLHLTDPDNAEQIAIF